MTLTEQERHDIDRANELGRQPVVLVHGLWLLSSSWDPWRTLIEEDGFVAVAPGWPDDPETVSEGRENPEVFARKMIGAVTDHYAEAISLLTRKPALIGHSFGGLIVQKLAGTGVAAATVAIDAAPFRGVLNVPLTSIRAGAPILRNPMTAGERSPSPSRSSPIAGRTTSPKRRHGTSTTPTTSQRRACRCSRMSWPT